MKVKIKLSNENENEDTVIMVVTNVDDGDEETSIDIECHDIQPEDWKFKVMFIREVCDVILRYKEEPVND